ncbi:class I SAM-dependent RNA methyltransferase [Arthrobacter roseus]
MVFVRHGIPGERVKVRLMDHDDDARFWRGDVAEVLDPSPDRVDHFWPEADALRASARNQLPVGGAEWGHMNLSTQRKLKGLVFAEQLKRLAGMERSVEVEAVPDLTTDGLAWRSRVAFSVTANGRLAMHPYRSNDLISVQAMPLAVQAINDLKLWQQDFSGIERVEVAAPSSGDPVLILLFPRDGVPTTNVHRTARKLVGGMSVAIVGPQGAVERVRGRTWVREVVENNSFRVSGPGFWQIHTSAPDVLTTAVLESLDPQLDEHLADLYAGAGLFSAALADRVGPGGTVLSMEASSTASRDARKNLHHYPGVDVQQGKVERLLSAGREDITGVVLDPPRVGAGRVVIERITGSLARRVVYVSCDPSSFARDVGYFGAAGWDLKTVRVFDLYPHTHHMESVAILEPAS